MPFKVSYCIFVFWLMYIYSFGIFVFSLLQHTPVFTNVQELFILVPALLGLKGNLEMTLASRLSTQSNIGNMDTGMDKCTMVKGNMALIQVI